MIDFLLVASLVGATLLVTSSAALARARKIWPALLGCSQCTGFWVGAAAGATGIVSVGRGRAVDAIVVGCATSFLAQAADALLTHVLGEPLEETKS